jgi:UDP-glucuronate 4-epimerase
MNSKHIFITGVAGFIGSHLAEALLKMGHLVTGVDNFDDFYAREQKEKNLQEIKLTGKDKFTFYEMDITDMSSLLRIEKGFDTVIHLAAKAGVRPSIQNPEQYIKVNINGTQNILDWMVKRKMNKLIFASSSSVYGNSAKVPFSENDVVDKPISPYAFTKKANEQQIYCYHHLYNIDALCLRFFTVYGPRQRPDLAIRKFIELIMANKPIEMYGDGESARDYTFVFDTVKGIISGVEILDKSSNFYEIINLGNSKPVTLSQMINTIYQEMCKKKKLIIKPMQPGDVDITYAEIKKAFNFLEYKPSTPFEDGIKMTIEYIQNK